MAAAQKATPRLPTVAIVIPKKETSPSMRPNELKKAKEGPANKSVAATPNTATAETVSGVSSVPGVAPEQKRIVLPSQPNMTNEIGESEMELVSSLAKLQKMEAMIHHLRTLLPERLLEPLAPIVNPRGTAGKSIPTSPQKLFEQLSQAARAGVAEVSEFQSMWRSPEMKAVWDRVDTGIKENGGQLIQPSGMWEQDYDILLDSLTKQDNLQKDQDRRSKEELERSKLQSTEGGWKTLVDSFAQRNVPGVRILPSKDDSSFIVLLGKAGLAFKVQTVDAIQGTGLPEWQVSSQTTPGHTASKLENAVLDCLNSRPKKWDMPYLLDMISSYANIKQTPCNKCSKMTDNMASLPVIRRPKTTESPGGPSQPTTWDAYHPTCLSE